MTKQRDKMPLKDLHERKMKVSELNEVMLKSFRVAKQSSITERISAIDFSLYGDTLISGDNYDQILVYDCDTSEILKTINVRKYGVDLVRFTRNPHHFIHTSTKVDHKIRLMNGEVVSYIDYFHGHTDSVTTLSMSQTDEKFLSASLDGTLRLWDLRSTDAKGIMNVSGRPIASFDPEGIIFAVGMNSSRIKLYDVRMFEKGPFISNSIGLDEKWADLKFSPDGRTIMINTRGSFIYLVDAYSLDVLRTITGKIRFFSRFEL